jgi:glycosyltransferase involved in cell wall biosynthesis
LKTLFFCNLVPGKVGAFERLLATLGQEFSRGGDDLVLALAGEPIPAVADSLREQSVAWHVVEGWDNDGKVRPWAFCLPALRLLRMVKPDVAVVHFGNELPSLAAALMSAVVVRKRTRWIWQQDQAIRDPSDAARIISRIRLLSLFFSRFVAVYEGGRTSLLRRGIPAGRIDLIPNSTGDHGPAGEPGRLRRSLSLPEDAVLLVSVGSMIARKRQRFILRAMARLRNRIDTRVDLLLLGEGPEKDDLQDLTHKLGLDRNVHFLGSRNDVRDILPQADVLVHASLREACAYGIIEAMCAGLPAVVTEAGAAREQIVQGQSGYVVGKDDIEGFVDHLSELVAGRDLRECFGRAARERWQDHYRVEASARKYYELYRRLAG